MAVVVTAGTNINGSPHGWQVENFFSALIAAQLSEAQHFSPPCSEINHRVNVLRAPGPSHSVGVAGAAYAKSS